MQIASFLSVPSSLKTHQFWIVGCRMEPYTPSALGTSSPMLPVQANPIIPALDLSKERIRKLFSKADLSVSSYDTAWVAMVPSPESPKSPRFPQCINWLIENQLNDGSWDVLHHDPRLLKDSLSSTLACIVALKRWNVGDEQVNKGLHFIESNSSSATDMNQPSPFGFEIIFPGMLEYAKDLNVNLPLRDLSLMVRERELQLKRWEEAHLAYVLEGLGGFTDMNMVMKYQMKNGSLFNSPSASAAAVIHHQNAGCLGYLTSLMEKYGDAVPTVYPFDLHLRLRVVDTLERLGITRHFKVEIQNVLDEAYRCWMQRDEQIFMDVVTCALAFRLLRFNGYEVSTDPLAEITKDGDFMNSLGGPFKDVYAALEVHRASQIIYQEELAFGSKSTEFLEQKRSSDSVPTNRLSKFIHKEVEQALKFPYNGCIERLSTKRNIQNYNVDNTIVLKTIYRSPNISNEDYLKLAVEDFNMCQSVWHDELKYLERWVTDYRLDKLKFARQKTAYCYFSAAAAIPAPELSFARLSWSINGILTTVIDDFFDIVATMDEVVNLVDCVERWDINADEDCCSEEVRILFLALKDAISWIGDNASKWQERDVTNHIIETWVILLRSGLNEARWAKGDGIPTLNEYMENGYISFALGPIILPSLYFIGPKLSEEVVRSSEYHRLYELVSTHGRVWNDTRSYKRELEAGKLNAVTLHMHHGKSGIKEEEVVEELRVFIKNQRRELMRLVLEEKGSVVPRACKDLFWTMCNVLELFYGGGDGFSGNEILGIVKEVIYEPVSHL